MSQNDAIVFEPHNDDFVIGMGGTGLKLLESGWDVTSVVLTDGRHGSTHMDPEETAQLRKEEKEREVSELGIDWVDLDLPDGSLMSRMTADERREEVVNKLSRAFNRYDPNIVFVPARTEGHPDHRATHDLVTSLIDGRGEECSLVEYVVWDVPFFAPTVSEPELVVKVEIDSTIKQKVRLIQNHQSQLREYPYDEMVKQYNKYLANIYHPETDGEFVELFSVHDQEIGKTGFLDSVDAKDVTSKFHSNNNIKQRF